MWSNLHAFIDLVGLWIATSNPDFTEASQPIKNVHSRHFCLAYVVPMHWTHTMCLYVPDIVALINF